MGRLVCLFVVCVVVPGWFGGDYVCGVACMVVGVFRFGVLWFVVWGLVYGILVVV